jgi:hypothetical protein
VLGLILGIEVASNVAVETRCDGAELGSDVSVVAWRVFIGVVEGCKCVEAAVPPDLEPIGFIGVASLQEIKRITDSTQRTIFLPSIPFLLYT